MANRQSAGKSGVRQARMSRSAKASKFRISSRLLSCSLSQPFCTHSCKLMLITDQKNLFAADHGSEKVVARFQFSFEFGSRINCWVDFPRERLLGRGQRRYNIAEADVPP